MNTLPSLTQSARALRQQPVTQDTRAQLERLREDAARIGAGPAFDTTLRALFADVYGGTPMPPVKVTFGGAPTSSTFGGAKGSALQFHALHKSATERAPVGFTTTTPPPLPKERQFALTTPAEKQQARAVLEKELGDLRTTVNGKRVSILDKIKTAPGLDAAQKERLLDVLSQVKHGYTLVGAAVGDKPGGPGYQDVNWKHTRLEVARVIDVVAAGKLTPAQAEVALLASVLSDSVKTPGNFLVHNVHGAQAAKHVLSRMVPPPSQELIDDVVKATLEHQIGPPGFMANVALRGALHGAKVDGALVSSITSKVAHPLDPKNLTADRAQIAFTDAEKSALALVGIEAWTVPHEGSRHYAASRAVIDGDSLVNYACPDGWAKLAALHGPDQPVFLQEPMLKDALLSMSPQHASALKSFHDARSVVSETSKPLYDAGLLRTKLSIDRVTRSLDQWVKLQRDVPKTKDGKVPYLDGALDYGNPKQLMFARRLRDEAVRLLREQEAL